MALVFGLFLKQTWLRNALYTAWLFAPRCIVAASISCLGSILMLVGMSISLRQVSGEVITDITPILQAFFISLITLVGVLVCIAWSFGVWLMRLTAYSRAFSSFSISDITQPLAKERVLAQLNEAMAEVGTRKFYLAEYYFFASLFLSVPFTVCVICILKLVLFNTNTLTQYNLPPSPAWVDNTATALAILFAIPSLAFTLVAIVVSAVTNQSAESASLQTASLTAKWFWQTSLVSLVVFLFLVVVSEPELILHMSKESIINIGTFKEDLTMSVVEALWTNAASLVLLPLSMAPICELLRGRVK